MTPKVAFSMSFFEAYGAMPKKVQSKIRSFVEKFKSDPTSAAIHYEPLAGMRDEKVRTVRIGLDYRAIVIHPPKGDVFLLVWVDHHDEAMAWAKRKRFEVNAFTGALQIFEELGAADADEAAVASSGRTSSERTSALAVDVVPEGRLFTGRSRADLLLLGVPEPLVPAVFALRTEADLDALLPYLPSDASDALYLVAAGDTLEGALAELEVTKNVSVDPEDFERALERAPTAAGFALVEDDADLASMLDAPLETWRLFLHPSQKRLVTMHAKGPVRVLGGAGTGKTVVAMHRARVLAKRLETDDRGERGERGEPRKVLFTTFTRNLAADIAHHLDRLCGPERERIDVQNLHRLAATVLKNDAGQSFTLVADDDARELLDDVVRELRAELEAARLPTATAYYADELRYVVHAQDLVTEDDYLRAKRTGRGLRVTRAQRKVCWKVFEELRARLVERGEITHADAIREARRFLETRPVRRYAAAVADEVQDLSLSELRFLRALVPETDDDLFLVGDAHQRIYGHKTSLAAAGIHVRGRRSSRLRLNYRTTQSIRRFAIALYRGVEVDDLDEGVDEGRDFRSLRVGPAPRVVHFATDPEELSALVAQVRTWLDAGRAPRTLAVVAPTGLDAIAGALKAAGITTVQIRRSADVGAPEHVRIATLHRVKGLEFACVWVAHTEALEVSSEGSHDDDPERDDTRERDRSLLYVACTRARDELVVSSSGPRVPRLPA